MSSYSSVLLGGEKEFLGGSALGWAKFALVIIAIGLAIFLVSSLMGYGIKDILGKDLGGGVSSLARGAGSVAKPVGKFLEFGGKAASGIIGTGEKAVKALKNANWCTRKAGYKGLKAQRACRKARRRARRAK